MIEGGMIEVVAYIVIVLAQLGLLACWIDTQRALRQIERERRRVREL